MPPSLPVQLEPSRFPVENGRLGQIDDHFAQEVVGFESIVVPNRELHRLEGEFGAEDRRVHQRLIPFRVERFRDGFGSTFVLRTSGGKQVHLVGDGNDGDVKKYQSLVTILLKVVKNLN